MQKFRMIAGSVLPGTGTDNAGLHMEIGHGTPIFSQCLIALAFARAGRGANTPAFLLTDEKIPGVVAGLVVSRRPVRGAPRTSQVQNCGQTSCRSLRTSTQGLRLTRSCAAGSHGSPVSSHLGISTDATPQHG